MAETQETTNSELVQIGDVLNLARRTPMLIGTDLAAARGRAAGSARQRQL